MSGEWFWDLSASGRMPLFWFFVGVVLGFLFIRLSVRLIRAQVKWWPGNVKPGGLHIHHVVFGVVLMLLGGVAGLVVPSSEILWSSVCAFVFGVGSALVLDEFALILHLKDVYWQESGRTSIDAVFVAVAVTGLLVLGIRPVFLEDLLVARQAGLSLLLAALIAVFHLGLAVITLLKGKIWTGLLGLFVLVLLYVGAIRLAPTGLTVGSLALSRVRSAGSEAGSSELAGATHPPTHHPRQDLVARACRRPARPTFVLTPDRGDQGVLRACCRRAALETP